MPTPGSNRPEGEREAIADLAYRIHLERVGQGSTEVDDWLKAEQRLVEEGKISADPRGLAPSQQGPLPATDGQVVERDTAAEPPVVR